MILWFLAITVKQTMSEQPGSFVKKIEFWWCFSSYFFIPFEEQTFRSFSAKSYIVKDSACLSSHLHNFQFEFEKSQFDFMALVVQPPGMCSITALFVVGIYFFVKKLDSHFP